MIHIFVGTKAQLIKMAPIMRELQSRGVDYNFIFSGQHQDTIVELRKNFGVKPPDIVLHSGADITSIPKMLFWMLKIIFVSFKKRKDLWRGDNKGIVLNHGDTFSTLLGTILARLGGHKAAHVESGLRSFNLFSPFPEELTRIIVFALSNIYFAPDQLALDNLTSYSGQKVNTGGNTLYDSLQVIKNQSPPPDLILPVSPYGLVSFHRFENIFRKEKITRVVEILERISETMPLVVIMHKPTLERLRKYGLYDRLARNVQIELRPRYDYLRFIQLVICSQFVVTDGGSNQEECYYLGKPCLLLRNATERQEGLGENARLSYFDDVLIDEFVRDFSSMVHGECVLNPSPTVKIVDCLLTPLK